MASPPEPATKVLDFAETPTSPTAASPSSRRHRMTSSNRSDAAADHIQIDTNVASARPRAGSHVSATLGSRDDNFSPSRHSVDSTLRRRPTRTNTVRRYHSPARHQFEPQFEEPGAEPGIDTQKDDPTSDYSHLHQHCEITVVDFSDSRCESVELHNDDLEEYLAKPQDPWVQCRWINVNGLSWDVIRMLGNHKQLHSLAIEDLMNTRGRTKADWYADQAFCKSMPFIGCSPTRRTWLFQSEPILIAPPMC